MSVFSNLKSYALGVGLALGALGAISPGAATAATVDADFTMSGDFVYDADVPALTLTGSGAAAYYVTDPSVVKNYALTFGLTLYPDDASGPLAISDTFTVGATSVAEVMDALSFISAGGIYGSISDGLQIVHTGFYTSAPSAGVIDVITVFFGEVLTTELAFALTGEVPTEDGFGGFDLSVEMSPVPLPATLPLLLVGFGGFAALRRRKS